MYEGIAQISPIYVRVARTLGATDSEIFPKVIIPLTVPHMLTALRVALGVAWATLVASELIAAQQGLGALIQNASSFFQLDIIYVGIICIGLIALAMDAVRAIGDAAGLVRQDIRESGLRDARSGRRSQSKVEVLESRRRACSTVGSAAATAASVGVVMSVRGSDRLRSRVRRIPVAARAAARRRRRVVLDRPGRIRRAHRPVGLRQDDDDEHRRRLRQADVGPRDAGRQADRRPRSRPRRHLPGIRRVPLADGANRTSRSA